LTQGMIDAKVRPGGRICHTFDKALNDSDKSFTVPTQKVWKILAIYAELLTDATVGNRGLVCSISNGTDNVWVSYTTGAVAASKRASLGIWLANTANTTARTVLATPITGNCDVGVNDTLPEMYIPEGYIIRVYDKNGIAAATDDLQVWLHYIEYDT